MDRVDIRADRRDIRRDRADLRRDLSDFPPRFCLRALWQRVCVLDRRKEAIDETNEALAG